MIVSFTKKWACAFDSDFLIAFDYILGRTEVYLSTGHKMSIPDESLDMHPAEFHKILQDDLVGRSIKRLEYNQQTIAHTVAVQQHTRLIGEVMEVIKEVREGDQGEPMP